MPKEIFVYLLRIKKKKTIVNQLIGNKRKNSRAKQINERKLSINQADGLEEKFLFLLGACI
jgi:hypothetical protein